MKTFSSKYLFIGAVLMFNLVLSCNKEDISPSPLPSDNSARNYSGETVRNYFSLLCKISKSTPGFFPPQVARAYGFVGIAAYEAVVNGIPDAQSLGGQLNGLSSLPKTDPNLEYNWGITSNTAIAEMIRKMFEKKISPENLNTIDSMETANLEILSPGINQDIINRSIQFGKDITDTIYQYSTTDDGHESYLDPFQLPYTMATDSFCWVPTGAVTTPVSPHWGDNRPFLKQDVDNTQPMAHVPFSSVRGSQFYEEAMAVYTQVKSNTFEQIEIAKYWADDPFNTCTPAGHTFNILTQLLEEDRATLEKTSVAYAKLSIAENDAFISCWKGKYKYVLIRPVSYINRYIDPSFTTVIGTPPFPAYTSGHSCEMGAGSRIFTNLFTDGSGNYDFTDYSQLQYGFSARNYSNFNDMAEECANSRFYGGIHYQMDNSTGLQIGRAIGDNINHILNWPTDIQ